MGPVRCFQPLDIESDAANTSNRGDIVITGTRLAPTRQVTFERIGRVSVAFD
jgi:hypothetical protein